MVKKMTTKEEFESDWLIAYRVSVNAWLDMFQQTIQFQRDIFNFFMKEKAELEQIYAQAFPQIINAVLQNGYLKSCVLLNHPLFYSVVGNQLVAHTFSEQSPGSVV